MSCRTGFEQNLMARTGSTEMLIKIADDNVGTIICNGIETYSVKCQFTVFDFDTDVFAHLSIYRSIDDLSSSCFYWNLKSIMMIIMSYNYTDTGPRRWPWLITVQTLETNTQIHIWCTKLHRESQLSYTAGIFCHATPTTLDILNYGFKLQDRDLRDE